MISFIETSCSDRGFGYRQLQNEMDCAVSAREGKGKRCNSSRFRARPNELSKEELFIQVNGHIFDFCLVLVTVKSTQSARSECDINCCSYIICLAYL